MPCTYLGHTIMIYTFTGDHAYTLSTDAHIRDFPENQKRRLLPETSVFSFPEVIAYLTCFVLFGMRI